MIRVVIAEDHHIVREGLRVLLERTGEIEIVGEADDGDKALKLIKDLQPDVALIDIVMPTFTGNQLLVKLKECRLSTIPIVLSMCSEPEVVREALKNGARGYLLKSGVFQELMIAIRACLNNEIYLSPAISQLLVDGYITEKDHYGRNLTPREVELLQLIAKGYKNREIAKQMMIALKTVENHRANIMKKLNVTNAAELIVTAVKEGIVKLDEQ
ncbi:MAG TPA: response regulator transcription factor [Hydrogenispora sp.]|jgi:two-component system response regulator NreC|nr:response regulator transcription factor [Hydrogenispora sp.]